MYLKVCKIKVNVLGLVEKWEVVVWEWKVIYEFDFEDRIVVKEVRRVELEFKKLLCKDYYKILGIEKMVIE